MGNPRIEKSNSPEVLALLAKPSQTGQNKARELALAAKKNGGTTPHASGGNTDDSDWAKWITATGGGLLGYSLASSFIDDKTYDEKRKESVWSKILRELASIGVGAAGAYGGYLLGKKAATNDVNNSVSTNGTKTVSDPSGGRADPLWDPRGNKWVLHEDATGDGPYVDLFGEKRDAAGSYTWPWFGTSVGSGVSGAFFARNAARRTGQWWRGGAPKEIIGKDGVTTMPMPENSQRIRALRAEIAKIEKGLATDAANSASYSDALRRIADENAQGMADHAADMKAKRVAYNENMQRFNREQASYNNALKAWNAAKGKKGKPPKPPVEPKAPTFKDFVPVNNPTPTPVSGYTQAGLDSAKAGLKRSLGRRAAGGWAGTIASVLTSYLTGRRGYENMKEEARVDDQLRAAGINPDTVNVD